MRDHPHIALTIALSLAVARERRAPEAEIRAI